MNRALRAATMGALLLGPIALSACSAGQVPQTATQNRDKVGPEAAVGDITLREITLAYPQDGQYEEGDPAELQMAIVNGDTEDDVLVGIEGEAFDGVVVSGQADASAVPSSPAATPTPASSTPAAPTTPGATPSSVPSPAAGAAPTSSAPAGAAASTRVQIPVPARSTVFLGSTGGPTVELAELTEELTVGEGIELTLTFQRAGEVTVPAVVAAPERALPRGEGFDFHEEEGGTESRDQEQDTESE